MQQVTITPGTIPPGSMETTFPQSIQEGYIVSVLRKL